MAVQEARSDGDGGLHEVSWSEPGAIQEEAGTGAARDGISGSEVDAGQNARKADQAERAPPLTKSVGDLSVVVGELKAHLERHLGVNEALELDLQSARRQVMHTTEDRQRLIERIARMEEEIASIHDMRSEIEQIDRERNALAVKVHDLGQALAVSEQRVNEIGQLLDRFRAERDTANEEVACLDSQLSRAIKVVEELRNELAARNVREEEFESRNMLLEEQLEESVSQRDSYRSELVESLGALEEVRMSILAASEESRRPVQR